MTVSATFVVCLQECHSNTGEKGVEIESGQGREIESDQSTYNTNGRHHPARVLSSAELLIPMVFSARNSMQPLLTHPPERKSICRPCAKKTCLWYGATDRVSVVRDWQGETQGGRKKRALALEGCGCQSQACWLPAMCPQVVGTRN